MKPVKHMVMVKIFYDRFNIPAVECPSCTNYIPNAKPSIIKCAVCGCEFRAVE